MLYCSAATKFFTGTVTLMNTRIWEPQIINGIPLYVASVLIPKDDGKTNAGMNTAVETALRVGGSIHRGAFVKTAKKNLPIIDGNREDLNEIFRGFWILNASSLTAPKIVDYKAEAITAPKEVQPGCKVRVSLSFFAYPARIAGHSGVGCMLGNIQKIYTRNDYEVLTDTDFDLFTENFGRIMYK